MLVTVEELLNSIALLNARLCDLEEENRKLREENSLLKERLGLNSTNSSLPPSRDLYKTKKLAVQDRPSLKKGGKVGHKGYKRTLLEATKHIQCDPPQTCSCGGKIYVSFEPQIHQTVDIPPIQPIVTNDHIYKGRCSCCHKRVSGS